MTDDRKLGKIKQVRCGFGGYQDAQLGILFNLSGKDWGVWTNLEGHWGTNRTDSCSWTEQDRIESLGKAFMHLRELLLAAKVNDISELVGKPVEAEFGSDRTLKSWRILEEVL